MFVDDRLAHISHEHDEQLAVSRRGRESRSLQEAGAKLPGQAAPDVQRASILGHHRVDGEPISLRNKLFLRRPSVGSRTHCVDSSVSSLASPTDARFAYWTRGDLCPKPFRTTSRRTASRLSQGSFRDGVSSACTGPARVSDMFESGMLFVCD